MFQVKKLQRAGAITVAIAAFAMTSLMSSGAAAGTLATRHVFCKQSGCPDGKEIWASLLMVDKRHFFGTARRGGAHDFTDGNTEHGGLVYELIHNKDGTWGYKVVYSFCAQTTTVYCADGEEPQADLIMDRDGNLYGTTWAGGNYTQGTVFQLKRSGSSWAETVIHSFHCPPTNCVDGQNPAAGLTYAGQSTGAPWDEFSPLYGTATNGGAYGRGVVFSLVNDGPVWDETVIHTFNSSSAPFGGMVMDADRNLYGATQYGGINNAGVFYKLNHDTWTQVTLHQFCSQTYCTDGSTMASRPVIDASGNLYGTTWSGGSVFHGVVFELVKGSTSYTYEVLVKFCLTSCATSGLEGRGLTIDSNGDLYGVVNAGGANGKGGLFRLHNGAQGWKENLLYSFCSEQGCHDGEGPTTAPILDANGNLFGTTYQGGNPTSDAGTVYEFTP